MVGEDGRRYLFTNNGWVAPLSDDGLEITGENKKVYDGWVYPKNWETEGDDMYLESPKLLFKDGYYYMTSAEGGTTGPATSHMCVMARSKSILGPWGHHSVLPLPGKDEWRIVYYRFRFPDAVTMGRKAGFYREVCIDKLEFDGNGYIMKVTPTL